MLHSLVGSLGSNYFIILWDINTSKTFYNFQASLKVFTRKNIISVNPINKENKKILLLKTNFRK